MSNIPITIWHALLALLTLLVTWLVSVATRWLNAHLATMKYGDVLMRVEQAVMTAVAEVAQTGVDDLKKAGTWDKAAMSKALSDALTKAKSYIGPTGLALLVQVLGGGTQADAFLKGKIEAHVRAQKTLALPAKVIDTTGTTLKE